MAIILQADCSNFLLKSLSASDYATIQHAMERIEAAQGECLCPSSKPIEFVFFPETAVVSLTTEGEPAREQFGLIGREAFSGAPVILCDGICPATTSVQVAGSLVRVPSAVFRAATLASPSMLALVLRHVQALLVQASSTAFSSGTHTVEQRLARWLLMADDRCGNASLALTHHFLAMMLNVRRPGITVATHVLEGEHAIRATRGTIQIIDREKLMAYAAEGYGTAEAEFERLLGVPLRRAAGSAA